MEIPARISFKGMNPSPAVEARIRQRIDRLARFHDRITSCAAVVEAPHRHGHKGQVYHVRVDVTVPGNEIVASKEPELNHAHEDVYVAVRDAFNAVERRLEDVVRRMGGLRVKAHPPKLTGTVVRLDPDEGFGFIADGLGREVYFPREAVTVPFGNITVGTTVRFSEHEGTESPCASAVTPV